MNDTVLYILLGLVIVSSLLAAMIKNTLKAVIALAVVSAALSVAMYLMNAPLAAVFELSVCAGLVTAIFASTLSLTESQNQNSENNRKRLNKYIFLPVIIIVVAGIVLIMNPALDFSFATTMVAETNVAETMWLKRNLDIAGQIVVILAGVFGVVILFKETKKQ